MQAVFGTAALVFLVLGAGNPPAREGARVSGWTLTDSGAPVPRADVRLACPPNPARMTVSDDRGLFVFENLPAGTCRLWATKDGYYGGEALGDPGLPSQYNIKVAAGALRDGFELKLSSGVTIRGTITGANGEPARDLLVHLIRREVIDGRLRTIVGPLHAVDRDGRFVGSRLPPGEYVVRAFPRTNGNDGGAGSGHAITYFPGVASPDAAQSFALTAGESKDIAFTMGATRAFRVSGTAYDAVGAPLAGAELGLALRDGLMRGTARTGPGGMFTFLGLQPGEYIVRLLDRGRSLGEAAFTVTDADVVGIAIRQERR